MVCLFVLVSETSLIRGGSRTAATSKMERFVIIANDWKPLTIITKRSVLDVATVLDPPLWIVLTLFFQVKNIEEYWGDYWGTKSWNEKYPKFPRKCSSQKIKLAHSSEFSFNLDFSEQSKCYSFGKIRIRHKFSLAVFESQFVTDFFSLMLCIWCFSLEFSSSRSPSHVRTMILNKLRSWKYTTRKMEFFIKDFFSKCEQINYRFGHIYWRNPQWKNSFFVQ